MSMTGTVVRSAGAFSIFTAPSLISSRTLLAGTSAFARGAAAADATAPTSAQP
jgi:hypothetical protein